MKPVKLIVSAAIITLCVLAGFHSCKKDKCRSLLCYNSGTCYEGTCTCGIGYEGATCQITSRNKFIGNWSATEQLTTGEVTHQYAVSISEGNEGINSVIITNLLNSAALSPIRATITNGTGLYIPAQQLAGNMVYGSGTISSHTLNLSVSVRNLGTGVTSSATYILYQ